MSCYVTLPIDVVKPNPRNARTHSKKQIQQIVRSIREFGFATPVLVDESYMLIAGHGRIAAARVLAMATVPALVLSGLTEAKKRTLMVADNRIAENAGWDRETLAIELASLSELLADESLDIALTGFEAAEIDILHTDFEEATRDSADDVDLGLMSCTPVSGRGDVWQLGRHRLVCGDAREHRDVAALMGLERAAMAFLDPPYNVRVRDVVGRGATKHREFSMASGEMSSDEFTTFLMSTLKLAAKHSTENAVHFVCIDWRHLAELIAAGRTVYADMLNLIAWVKSNAGQGSFYRSQRELIGVYRVGSAPHQNNIELGRHGRNRSNVWHYAGVNTFGAGRMDVLSAHPTVKPSTMVADAIKDCTRRGDIILDTFCGSGTTILAAERVGRQCFGLEIDPGYVDLAIQRWQSATGRDARHVVSALTFDEVKAKRGVLPHEPPAPLASSGVE